MTRKTADERRRAAGRTCAYCGLQRLDGRQGPEHPIPLVLGSRLTVFTVCDPCNEQAGRRVDAPWLSDFFVQNARADAGVVDPRHKAQPVKHPLLNGVFLDEEGHRVVATDGVPSYPGSIVEDGDTASIVAATPERAAELLERLKRRLAEKGQEVGEFTQEVHEEQRPRVSRRVSTRLSDGVRMGAKLALAFAAEVYDEDWRTSPDAERLRGWLWSDRPTDDDGVPLGWVPTTTEAHPFAEPPNHVVYFGPAQDATALTVLVLGKLGLTIPVAPLSPRPETAWRIPLGELPEQTTFDEMVLALVQKQIPPHGDDR